MKTVPKKKTISPKTIAKKISTSVISARNMNIETVIEQQGKQIQKMDAMLTILDGEIKELKKLVSPAVVMTKNKPEAEVAPKKPIRGISSRKNIQKTVSMATPVKTSIKAPAKAKNTVKVTANTVKKSISSSFSADIIDIPADIPNRIFDLTSKKKVTQTQLGKDVELSQKAIQEIASRKVKELNKDKIKKIRVALKKYERK